MARSINLKDSWLQTFGTDKFFFEVIAAYQEPHRHYHTVTHLESCFDVLNNLFPKATDAVKVALWFHDFVYDPKASDNEEKSANVAADHCPSYVVVSEVTRLILATKHHTDRSNPNVRTLLDVDLSILSEAPEVFDKYEDNIRLEYDWVPLDAYKKGRTKILKGFLDRVDTGDTIYHTEEMRPWEDVARNNIRRSLEKLNRS